MPRAARALVLSCHPGPCVAVTAVTTALAASTGRSAPGVVAVAAAVLAGQLSVGWSNDALDVARDRAAGRPDKPIALGLISPRAVWAAAATAAVAAVPLSMLSGWRAGALHLVAVALAWSYNLRVKATPASAVPYVLAFAALPSFVTLGLPAHRLAPWWATGAGALLGLAAHFSNVVPDIADDLATGIRGLPQRLGAAVSRRIAAIAVVAATLFLAIGPTSLRPVAVAALVLVAGIAVAGIRAERQGHDRGAFLTVLAVAGVNVALLLVQGGSLLAPR